MVLRRGREIGNAASGWLSLNVKSLLSPDQNGSRDGAGVLRSMRTFTEGLLVLVPFIYVWLWLNRFVPFGRYVQAVFVLLLLMGGYSIGVMAERFLRYGAARNQSRAFAQQVAGSLCSRDLDQAIAIARRYPMSPIAKVAGCGLASFQAALPLPGEAEIIEAARRGMRRSAKVVHADLRRGLDSLVSIATTAPLVGVFGTIFGILDSFVGAGIAKSTYMAIVVGRLAEALLPTASALFLAVLTQWCCNYLRNELEAFDREMENQSLELANYLTIYLGQRR